MDQTIVAIGRNSTPQPTSASCQSRRGVEPQVVGPWQDDYTGRESWRPIAFQRSLLACRHPTAEPAPAASPNRSGRSRPQRTVSCCAQTSVQLFNQLRDEGYSHEERGCVAGAYTLALDLFTCLFQPPGKPFLDHLVGTASVLASLHAAAKLVAAGVLHAAYVEGDFGGIGAGLSKARRARVRRTVGVEVEAYVARYTTLEWSTQTIPALRDDVETCAPIDRAILLMRLANELEFYTDLATLHYRPNTEGHRAYIEHYGPAMIDIASKLGSPVLAAALTRAFKEVVSADVVRAPLGSRCTRTRAYLIAPRSYRKQPVLAVWDHIVRQTRRFKARG